MTPDVHQFSSRRATYSAQRILLSLVATTMSYTPLILRTTDLVKHVMADTVALFAMRTIPRSAGVKPLHLPSFGETVSVRLQEILGVRTQRYFRLWHRWNRLLACIISHNMFHIVITCSLHVANDTVHEINN